MKTILLTFFLFLSTLQAQNTFRFFINNLNLPMDNRGFLAEVNIPGGGWGQYLTNPFLYSGGFWFSGYNEDTLWANSQATLMVTYQPGNVDSNQYDPRFKIYVVNKSDPPFGHSWQEWIFAVDIGAEFYDGDNDSVYNPVDLNGNGEWDINEDSPDLIGDQVAWCVFNDGVYPRLAFPETLPLGIEIHQTLFGYNRFSAPQLKNTIFIRYKIYNTGKANPILDSVYFTTWTDSELGRFDDDLVGCDTLINSGFTYNSGPDLL